MHVSMAACSCTLRASLQPHVCIYVDCLLACMMWHTRVRCCCCSAPQVTNQVTTNQGSAAAAVGAAAAVTPLPTQGTSVHPPQLSDTPGRPWSSLDSAGENQGGTPSGVVLDKLARGSPWSTAIKGAEFKSPKVRSGISLQLFVTCMHGQPSLLCAARCQGRRQSSDVCKDIRTCVPACTDGSKGLCGFLQAVTDIADLAQLDDLGGSLPQYDLQELPPSWKAMLSDPEACVTDLRRLPGCKGQQQGGHCMHASWCWEVGTAYR